ncbi:glycosyltransferase family 2 protein [Massilia sp. B-10]|nr:glycosyltransferase family 2 protein [Massilia sp. B-10]
MFAKLGAASLTILAVHQLVQLFIAKELGIMQAGPRIVGALVVSYGVHLLLDAWLGRGPPVPRAPPGAGGSMTAPVSISVIVPAYNVEAYVGAALDSLLAQSVPFHEIIVIDDGSTDATSAVLARYRGLPGVRIERVANGGLGRARNLGITLASGEFVYFFDSDDLLVPTFGARMQALLGGRPEVDIVYFSGLSFVDPGCKVDYLLRPTGARPREYASGVAATGAMLQAGVLFSSACLYVSRRTLWADGALAFAPIVHEDEELLTVLSCKARVSLCIDDVLFGTARARRVAHDPGQDRAPRAGLPAYAGHAGRPVPRRTRRAGAHPAAAGAPLLCAAARLPRHLQGERGAGALPRAGAPCVDAALGRRPCASLSK